MMNELVRAVKKYNDEVDTVAISLIESGIPPWLATKEAAKIVYRRRMKKVRK